MSSSVFVLNGSTNSFPDLLLQTTSLDFKYTTRSDSKVVGIIGTKSRRDTAEFLDKLKNQYVFSYQWHPINDCLDFEKLSDKFINVVQKTNLNVHIVNSDVIESYLDLENTDHRYYFFMYALDPSEYCMMKEILAECKLPVYDDLGYFNEIGILSVTVGIDDINDVLKLKLCLPSRLLDGSCLYINTKHM